jgi:hypothetical protein
MHLKSKISNLKFQIQDLILELWISDLNLKFET